MGFPPSPTPNTHLYPQELQLKLYQAFIFSIPILFSIILFLLFYLFYLKRRATSLSSSSSSSHILPTTTTSSNQAAPHMPSVCQIGLKEEIKDNLPIVLFDEEIKKRETMCCVCLGEFEMKEELLQMPSCKHVFHRECIHNWLHTNTTCPLCRSFVIPSTKFDNLEQPHAPDQPPLPEQQQQEQDIDHNQVEQIVIYIEEPRTDEVCSRENINGRASSSTQQTVPSRTQLQ